MARWGDEGRWEGGRDRWMEEGRRMGGWRGGEERYGEEGDFRGREERGDWRGGSWRGRGEYLQPGESRTFSPGGSRREFGERGERGEWGRDWEPGRYESAGYGGMRGGEYGMGGRGEWGGRSGPFGRESGRQGGGRGEYDEYGGMSRGGEYGGYGTSGGMGGYGGYGSSGGMGGYGGYGSSSRFGEGGGYGTSGGMGGYGGYQGGEYRGFEREGRGFGGREGREEDRGMFERLGDRFREGMRKLGGHGPKGFRRSDDRIRDDVCERIARSWVDSENVEVKVDNAEVTLSGTVQNREDKRRLEDIAEDVFGVDEVHNHIRVSRGMQTETSGTQTTGAQPGQAATMMGGTTQTMGAGTQTGQRTQGTTTQSSAPRH